ncbi:hypothetical protein ADL02_37515 [Streptomyces sp. NRRL WC-3723]|nr:hypothetical protein ADL02_37515 [Streptomyces sp. NRRL WC-3723]
MLTTLLKPTGGAATVAGHDLATDPAGVRRVSGYVAQSGGVDPQTWLDVLSHFVPFRYLVDAVRDAYVGVYTSAHMLYGVLVAVGFAVLAVTAGTRVFRTAGA